MVLSLCKHGCKELCDVNPGTDPYSFNRVFRLGLYFHIVFVLLVVDCQLEILEFSVIYNDVIDRPRNVRPHRKI